MGWRLAKSIARLRSDVNNRWPDRDKTADGTIGDAAHRSRRSDHNPNSRGVVTAIDITHWNGIAQTIWDELLAARDPRIKYMIFNRRIVSSTIEPWKPRLYSGSNAHTKHIHISVSADPNLYDDGSPWFTGGEDDLMFCNKGDQGPKVAALQHLILQAGGILPKFGADSDYGGETATGLADLIGGNGEVYGPVEYAKLMTVIAKRHGGTGKHKHEAYALKDHHHTGVVTVTVE